MNKRLIWAGAISIVIALVILISNVPPGMAMIAKSPRTSVLLLLTVYQYVGYALGAVGLVLLHAGLLSKPGE